MSSPPQPPVDDGYAALSHPDNCRIQTHHSVLQPEKYYGVCELSLPPFSGRLTHDHVILIQMLIEHCLIAFMDVNQTALCLFKFGGIDHRITERVWSRLKKENPEFYFNYDMRLLFKKQKDIFQTLIKRHEAMTERFVPVFPVSVILSLRQVLEVQTRTCHEYARDQKELIDQTLQPLEASSVTTLRLGEPFFHGNPW